MVTEDEKCRAMTRCVESMPKQWTIADKCYQRGEMLGKGSWAMAFSAKLVVKSKANNKTEQQDEPISSEAVTSIAESRVFQVLETIEAMGESIAVKAIVKEAHSEQSMEKYPRREMDLMRRLTGHDNVIKLYAFWQDDLCFYLAMELCANRSLSGLIKSKDPCLVLSRLQIKRYLVEMLQGLRYIHRQMIVHRDIKPDNVLLTAKKQIKISDFGLSTTVGSVYDLLYSFCGTPKYQAPEIVKKIGYNFPVDVWAAGCIFYRLHYQSAPFDGNSSEEIYEKLLSKYITYRRSNRWCRQMHGDDLRIMRWMLRKNPRTRASIEQLLADKYLKQTNCRYQGWRRLKM